MKVRSAALAAIVVIGGVGATRMAVRRPAAPGQPPQAPPKLGGLGGAEEREVAIPVEVTTVRRGTMLRTLAVTGTLKTDRDISITSKVPGKVASVTVKEGDRVSAGQLLVALDDADFRAQLEQAQASLKSMRERLGQTEAGEDLRYAQTDAQIEQAEANLKTARLRVQQLEAASRITDTSAQSAVARAESGLKAAKDRLRIVKEGARDQERRVAENAVEQAKVNLETIEARVARRRALFKQGAISREDLDEHEKQLKLAQSQLNSATQQRDLMKEGARSEEVRIAEEQVRQAEEAVREAQANIERTNMSHDDVEAARATVTQLEAGLKVARANKAQYQIVPREIAASRAAVEEAQARVRYAEEQLRHLKISSPVDGVVSTCAVNVGESIGTANILMNVIALNGVYFEAQVPELNLADVRTGFPAKVTVDSLPGKLFRGTIRDIIPVSSPDSKTFRVRVSLATPGQLPVGAFARGDIEIGQQSEALLVPKECLLSIAGETYLFVVANGSVRRQAVEIGGTDTRSARLLSGVKEGDRVVISGVDTLSDGSKVTVVTGSAPSAQSEM